MSSALRRWAILPALLSAMAASAFQLEGNELILSTPPVFQSGKALVADDDPALQEVKAYLEGKRYISRMRIEGHVGDHAAAAAGLGAQRAMAVSQALVRLGIDCHRLLPVDFGDTKPVSTDVERNTRISFINAELAHHAIGGLPLDGGGRALEWPCGE